MVVDREKLIQIISEKSIMERVHQIADDISNQYKSEVPILIGILNGSFIFASDLVRAMKIDCEIDFIKVSSYSGTKSKGTVHLKKDISADITDRHVIIVEDIIDSGLTIRFIRERLLDAQPKSVSIVTLLMKPELVEIDFDVNWVGFEIPPHYVVGYGLDYDQKFRNLRGIFRLGGK
ncbi:MAG: hypoxanthine phosphoribosyltransferase [Candidatus Marinimicrobia bacterium]|nr:hypoxanthine phosphoribosyltransferase [Candidatus Neomarinimicrobiota bacterium]MAQ74019.1 hypoxanthine phosphoribosyltransferase [Candidatus Neomarinimicrobiota bacterium]|tara:strand:- start:648 stop:1178 length:531 start_codon:yes stop_codon:yes gene_type:complete